MARQHLIDPEICSACLSCLPMCPERAIVERGRRVVIDPDRCKDCGVCIEECTTGAIENWIDITDTPFSLDEQFAWDRLP